MRTHMLSHEQQLGFVCQICGTKFNQQSSLIRHKKLKHKSAAFSSYLSTPASGSEPQSSVLTPPMTQLPSPAISHGLETHQGARSSYAEAGGVTRSPLMYSTTAGEQHEEIDATLTTRGRNSSPDLPHTYLSLGNNNMRAITTTTTTASTPTTATTNSTLPVSDQGYAQRLISSTLSTAAGNADTGFALHDYGHRISPPPGIRSPTLEDDDDEEQEESKIDNEESDGEGARDVDVHDDSKREHGKSL